MSYPPPSLHPPQTTIMTWSSIAWCVSKDMPEDSNDTSLHVSWKSAAQMDIDGIYNGKYMGNIMEIYIYNLYIQPTRMAIQWWYNGISWEYIKTCPVHSGNSFNIPSGNQTWLGNPRTSHRGLLIAGKNIYKWVDFPARHVSLLKGNHGKSSCLL